MRKLFSALAVVLVFAMAFTITASAAITGTEVYQPVGGKYTVTAQDDSIKSAMVGMVVIEAAQDPETFTIDEDDIRYIDQVTADAAGNISIPAFAPMAKTVDTNKYLVYVGGGSLAKATKVGELNVPIAPTGVTLDKETADVKLGSTLTLNATIAPTGATGNLIWESTDNTKATVVNGVVTPVAVGKTTIKVTIEGTTHTDECEVTVSTPDPTGVTLDKETAELALGKTLTLTATIAPTGATGNLIWESTDTTKATVVDGVVTPIAVGETTITVSIEGTSFSDSCEVEVVEKATVVYGDVDQSGAVNPLDATKLARHFARWSANNPVADNFDYWNAFTNGDFSSANADVDANGSVNPLDATKLSRHSARWSSNNPVGDGIDYRTLPIVSN